MHNRRAHFALIIGIFVLIAASRIQWLASYDTDRDEILSINRTLGTPEQIIHWSPPDWPPLYNLVLAGWKEIVGIHPLPLRTLSVLFALIGFACMYRAMKRLHGERAGLLAALTYAALGISVIINIKLRGYAMLHALIPLALWLTMRYFDRPSWRRALPLGVTLAVMFYVTLISVMVFGLLGVYTLLIYRRAVWRWLAPGIIGGVLALPEIIDKLGIASEKATAERVVAPFVEKMPDLFRGYAGEYHPVWAILIFAAAALVLWDVFSRRRGVGLLLTLVAWIVAAPIAMYLFLDPLFVETSRYSFWVAVGMGIVIGWGFKRLPTPGYLGIVALLAALLFAPVQRSSYYAYAYTTNFSWLTQNIRWGDVLLVDPNCACPEPQEWHYYARLYFPNGGLQFVDDPQDHRRVWYITGESAPDRPTRDSVREGRVRGAFVGSPSFLFQLYEAPPDADGILFENGMRFHGYEIVKEDGDAPWSGDFAIYEGKTLRLRQWWSVDRPLDADYSVANYLMFRSSVQAQFDGPPQLLKPDAPRETSRWTPGELYVEERAFTIPYSERERPLDYTLYLTVYQWWDNTRIPAPGVDDNTLLRLFDFVVRPV